MSNDEGFFNLWPTLFLQRHLPSAETANAALSGFILDLEKEHAQLTTDYQAQNLFEHSHPAVQWLHQSINKTLHDYLAKSGVTADVRWNLQGWANINRYGDYHTLHNHPHSYLSGTYYVRTPQQHKATHQRSDLNPGSISFFDPRAQANMTAIAGDPQIDPEYRIMPSAGMVLLWPSFLHHTVHPNFSDEPRVSISFNMVLQRGSSVLPQQ